MRSLLTAALCLALCGTARAAAADTPPPAPAAPPPPAAPSADEGAQPGPQVNRRVFEERLSPYGRWVVTPDYGRVWVPNNVAADWRPYSSGRWVYTDWGWTFVSDDPYGWAVYHYGRWNFAPAWGWYWVPGRIWAPAWVSWRYGGGYSAWVPMGPRGVVWGVSSPYWVAVRNEHFTQPIRTVALSGQATAGAVAAARPIPGPAGKPMQGQYGPPSAAISKATGHAVVAVAAPRVVPGARAFAGPRGGPGRAGRVEGGQHAGPPPRMWRRGRRR